MVSACEARGVGLTASLEIGVEEGGHELGGGVLGEGLCRSSLDDASSFEYTHVGLESDDVARVMGDDDRRGSALLQMVGQVAAHRSLGGPESSESVAMAFAEVGDFRSALQWQERAISLAERASDSRAMGIA